MINISFQVAGLVNVIVILLIYLSQKKLLFKTTKQLMRMILLLILNLILDIVSLVLINYREDAWVTGFVCKSYLVVLPFLAYTALDYVMYDIYKSNTRFYNKFYEFSMIAVSIAAFATYLFPLKVVNKPGFGKDLSDGPAIIWTYIWAVSVLVFTFVTTIVKRKQMNKGRGIATRVWVLLWMGAALLQYLWNYILETNYNLLLVGFGCSAGIVLIYITLENYGFYMHKTLGIFNRQGCLSFVSEIFLKHKMFSMLFIIFDNRSSELNSHDSRKKTYLEVVDLINRLNNDGYLFNYETNTFAIVRKNNDFDMIIDAINNHYKGLNPVYVDIINPYAVDRPTKLFNMLKDVVLTTHPDNERRVILCTDDYIHKLEEKTLYEDMIEKLIQRESIEIAFQPIYSITENKFSACEALVRLIDLDGNHIMPGLFIPYAEASGLIVKLGRDIMREVCKFLNEFDISKYGMEYVEVNLSIVQLQQENMANEFIAMLKEYNIDPKLINFEVTESSYSKNHLVLQNINRLIENGSSISLDDFGTGSSNLEYIINLPADIIKFDKVMVQSYFTDSNTRLVMNDIVKMIKTLNKKIVFEGIEELSQLQEAEKLLVDYIQGFYFSKPLFKDNFIEFVKTRDYNSEVS